MRGWRLFFVFLSAVFLIPFALSEVQNITSCGGCAGAGGPCVLQNNISSSGTCITITGNNGVLDCNGYTINYSSQTEGGSSGSNYYGVLVDITSSNATIKNCNFIQENSTAVGMGIYAIFFTSGDNNGTVIYNTGSLKKGDAIKLDTANGVNVTGNNFNVWSASNGIYVSKSNNTLIRNNFFSINGSGSGSNSRGVWVDNGQANLVENNVISHNANSSSESQQGMRIFGYHNTIRNNTIVTSNVDGLRSSGADNTIVGNSINASGDALVINVDTGINDSIAAQFNSTVANNTVFGKPILYYANLNSLSIANNDSIGQILIYNTNNVYLSNLTMSTKGLRLIANDNLTLLNSTFISNISAIYAYNLTNLLIKNNNFTKYNDNRTGGSPYLNLYGIRYSNITSNTVSLLSEGSSSGGMPGDGCIPAIGISSINSMGSTDAHSNIISSNTITTWGAVSCGLNLQETSNNTISSNTITGNSNNSVGVLLMSGMSVYNNFSSNRITMKGGGSTSYVVVFSQMGPPNSNTFYNNIFNISSSIGNGSGVNVQTGGMCGGNCTDPENFWNITSSSSTNIVGGPTMGGNYWTNSSGTGFSDTCEDSNKDGICDSSFVIDGNNTDYLPLSKYGLVSVLLVSPSNSSYRNAANTNFTCNATSVENSLTNVTLYIWSLSNSLVYSKTANYTGLSNLSIINYSFSSDGSYKWNCLAYSNLSYSAWASSNYTITYDSTPPYVQIGTLPGVPQIIYYNISNKNLTATGGASGYVSGIVNETNIANWTVKLYQNGTLLNSSLCFNSSTAYGDFCQWNTTAYCAGECENYTLELNATDLAGNNAAASIDRILLDNLAPSISSNGTLIDNNSSIVMRLNVSDNYLVQVAVNVFDSNNQTVVGWIRIGNESQTGSFSLPGSGTFNRTWNKERYEINGSRVGTYFSYGPNTIAVPGCFKENESGSYDCGCAAGNPSCMRPYYVWLIFNESTQSDSKPLLGIGNDLWNTVPGVDVIVNSTIIQNGVSKFIPQREIFHASPSSAYWEYQNLSEITLYTVGSGQNMNITYKNASGWFHFMFAALDLFNSQNNIYENFEVSGTSLAAEKTVLTQGTINIGDNIGFLINLTNTGETNITNISVVDIYDVDLNYSSASPSPSQTNYTGRRVYWNNFSTLLRPTNSTLIYVNFTAVYVASIVSNQINVTYYDSEGNFNSLNANVGFNIQEDIPPMIAFMDQTTTSSGNHLQSYIYANVTAADQYSNISVITIRLYNSTGSVGTASNLAVNDSSVYLSANFTSLPDGTYYLNASAVDSYNNTNWTTTRTIVLDTQAPVVRLITPANSSRTKTSNNTHYFNVSDAAGYANCTMYWTDYSPSNSVNFGFVLANGTAISAGALTSSDGNVNWLVNCTDYAGNIGTSGAFNYTVDTHAPNATLVSPSNNAYVSNQTQNYTANISDNLGVKNATLNIYNSSNGLVNSTSVSFLEGTVSSAIGIVVDLADNVYRWFYKLFDWAENSYTTGNRSITIDTAAPSYSNNYTSPSSGTNYSLGHGYEFGLTWTDATSSVSKAILSFNGTNYTMTNESNAYHYNLTNLAAGSYSYYFWANDSAGNSNQTEVLSYVISKASSNVSCSVNNSRVNLTLDIGTSGVSMWLNATLNSGVGGNVYLYKNKTLINSGNSSLANYTLFNRTGVYNITAIYTESQNYTSGYETWWVTATDSTAPSITVLSPGNTSYFTGQLIKVNFSAIDLSGVGVLWHYNTSDNATFESESYINFSNGSYTFTFYANDSYNNLASKAVTFSVKELASNQSILNDSSFTVEANTTEIILPANQSLSQITIPSNRTETEEITLNLGQIVDSNGNMSFGGNVNMTRQGSSANYSVEILSDVIVIGGSNWSGEFRLPTSKSISGLNAPSISGYTTTLEKVIIAGSSVQLNFSSPVKLRIGAMAGKKAAWSRIPDFTDIPVYCNNNESTPTNINASSRECYTNDSSNTDLIIWTYHFTDFAAYSMVAVASAPPGGGGSSGGGGGGANKNCTTNWNCSSWNTCTNGMQTRNCSKISSACSAGAKPSESQTCSLSNGSQNANGEQTGTNLNIGTFGNVLFWACAVAVAVIAAGVIIFFGYKKHKSKPKGTNSQPQPDKT